MNPFAEHAKNMESYEGMCAEPIDGSTGNSVKYGGADFQAVVSAFVLHRELTAGGWVNKLMGQAIVQKKEITSSVIFKTGEAIIVRQIGGSERMCRVEMVEDQFTEWRIHVVDLNE